MSRSREDIRARICDHLRRHPAPALAAVLLGFFACTLHPWWVPTGDSEVYLVGARNLVNGRGLTFLDEPLAFVPPTWTLVLAGMMRLGLSILSMKLALIACMTGGLVLFFLALDRATGRRRLAIAAVLLAALCSPLYPLTFWLHTDALFMLVAGGAVYAGLRFAASTGRAATGWITLCAALVALGVSIRWAGLPYAVVPAAAAFGMIGARRSLAARLLAAVGIVAVAGASFVLIRSILASGGGVLTLAAIEEAAAPSILIRQRPHVSIVQEYLGRLATLPHWFGWTLYSPSRFLGALHPAGRWVDLGVGLLAVGMLLVGGIARARRGDWLILGSIAYVLALCVGWPGVNNRYVVPVLPMVIAGILVGLRTLIGWRWAPVWRGLRWAFVAMLLLTNGFMWSVDLWVARAPIALDFYARYEAGIHLSLLEVAADIGRRPDARQATVSTFGRYENLGERWNYKHAQRVTAYVADVEPLGVPAELLRGSGIKPIQNWARANAVRYHVHQNPTRPGRAWHFRLSFDQHAAIEGFVPEQQRDQFELYQMRWYPTRKHPDARWLTYTPAAPLRNDDLDRLGRRVPHLEH